MKQLKFQITVHMDVDMTLSLLLIFTFSAGNDADGACKVRRTQNGGRGLLIIAKEGVLRY